MPYDLNGVSHLTQTIYKYNIATDGKDDIQSANNLLRAASRAIGAHRRGAEPGIKNGKSITLEDENDKKEEAKRGSNSSYSSISIMAK